MSTCRTLTLGCRCPIINWPQEKLTVSAPYKRMSIRTVLPIDRWNASSNSPASLVTKVPLKFAGKVIPNLQCNKRNPKLHRKKQRENWQKILFLSIYPLGHWGNFSDTVVGSCQLRFLFFSILSSSFSSF